MFSVNVMNNEGQNVLDNVLIKDIYAIYKGVKYPLAVTKPEECSMVKFEFANFYGLYLEDSEECGKIICFGEVDLVQNPNYQATIELYIGERKYILSAKYYDDKITPISYSLDDKPCDGNPFVIVY